MIHCSTCHEGTMTEAQVEDYDARALFAMDQAVLLGRVPALVCDQCGAVMLSGGVIGAAEIAFATLLVEQDGELRPREVKFLRAMLSMTQVALAERLETNQATVAQWESGEVVPGRLPSLALRSLAAWRLIEKDPGLAGAFSEHFVRSPRVRVALPTAPR